MPGPLRDLDDRRRYANAYRLKTQQDINNLTRQLLAGEIDPITWQVEMRDILRDAHKVQFVIGRGGLADNVTLGDYGALGPMLREQYAYLQRFALDVEAAIAEGRPLTFVENRANLYARATQQAFWNSVVPVQLPQVPRDGQTQCKTNCKCRLRIEYKQADDGRDLAVLVYWKLHPAEHCDDCLTLARTWNPLEIPMAGRTRASYTPEQNLFLMATVEDIDDKTQFVEMLTENFGVEACQTQLTI